jgi:hypothetical protein
MSEASACFGRSALRRVFLGGFLKETAFFVQEQYAKQQQSLSCGLDQRRTPWRSD